MRLTTAELEAIRAEAFAEDTSIPQAATSWTRTEAVEFFESGGTLLPGQLKPTKYVVFHQYVNVRSTPTRTGAVLGKKDKGTHLEVDQLGGQDDGWVRLKGGMNGQEAWVLIDGSSMGLPQLIGHFSGPPLKSRRWHAAERPVRPCSQWPGSHLGADQC